MFNPLTPAEVVTAIGRSAREAARGGQETSDFSRGQLLSAYSCSRHITVEIESYGPELESFAADVAQWTRAFAASGAAGTHADALQLLSTELDVTGEAREIGELTCILIGHLREADSEAARDVRRRIQARLRNLADREVELLAAVIESEAKT